MSKCDFELLFKAESFIMIDPLIISREAQKKNREWLP